MPLFIMPRSFQVFSMDHVSSTPNALSPSSLTRLTVSSVAISQEFEARYSNSQHCYCRVLAAITCLVLTFYMQNES